MLSNDQDLIKMKLTPETSMECCLFNWLATNKLAAKHLEWVSRMSGQKDILCRQDFILEITTDDFLSWQANYSEVFLDRRGFFISER